MKYECNYAHMSEFVCVSCLTFLHHQHINNILELYWRIQPGRSLIKIKNNVCECVSVCVCVCVCVNMCVCVCMCVCVSV